MQNEIKSSYVPPQMEILEIEVENGFVVSLVSVEDWNNGEHLGDYELE
ncbi:MAG: hypothetical protein J6B31_00660 [Bacteroidaceae bacterium]|nr:hypothetical protein [Bacteroidaceae bacterium]